MVEDFVSRATELGANVHFATGQDEAVAIISGVFRDSGAMRVALSPDLGALRAALAETLSRIGAQFVDCDAAAAMAAADLGVTRSALGIAETGSILVSGNESIPRLASMLPLVHIAVLRQEDLVPSLDEAGDFLRRVSTAEAPNQVKYAALVSGPSRTSDVEKTLSVGVHGPGQLHIILLS